jgi:hypothetical protein
MTLSEFKKSVYHTEKNVIIPSLNRLRIDKTKFIIKGKYKPELLNDYLEELYEDNYYKIIK